MACSRKNTKHPTVSGRGISMSVFVVGVCFHPSFAREHQGKLEICSDYRMQIFG